MGDKAEADFVSRIIDMIHVHEVNHGQAPAAIVVCPEGWGIIEREMAARALVEFPVVGLPVMNEPASAMRIHNVPVEVKQHQPAGTVWLKPQGYDEAVVADVSAQRRALQGKAKEIEHRAVIKAAIKRVVTPPDQLTVKDCDGCPLFDDPANACECRHPSPSDNAGCPGALPVDCPLRSRVLMLVGGAS